MSRLAQERFLIITGSAQATRDMDWISRNIGSNKVAILTDVSAQFCVLSLMGPYAFALLARVSPDENPFEAGLAYAVNLNKAVPF